MSYRYVIFGAGRQGMALAYGLARQGEAACLTLAERAAHVAEQARQRLEALLKDTTCRVEAVPCDVSKPAEVAMVLTQADVAISAVPYRYNVALTDAAIAAGVSFCDLGGNTAVVREQLARHDQAAHAGVSIVPDCGLAPGLGNILAAAGVAEMDRPEHVHVRCGGLPIEPVGPLGYKLVFNFGGLLNEYSGYGEFLREGERVQVPALSELEEIEFPPPVGRCEAAVTSGGTSTCADTFAGRLRSYDYKTVRYPGHFLVIRALFDLGCFEAEVETPGGAVVRPQEVLRALLETRLAFPDVPDLVVLRCSILGEHGGRAQSLQYDLFDRADEATGFSAMERTTAFPTALVAHMQAAGELAAGAQPVERCVPTAPYLGRLADYGLRIEKRVR